MSLRMLQRALKSQDHQKEKEKEEDEDEEEEKEEDETKISRILNPFDLLGNQEEDEIDTEDAHSSAEDTQHIEKIIPKSSLPTKLKKKKKGKKIKKGKSLAPDLDAESVDQLLERLALSERGTMSPSTSETTEAGNRWSPIGVKAVTVLSVDPKFLKAEDELKRIFGSKVINAVERGNAAGGSMGGVGRRPGVSRRSNRGSGVSLRKKTLVTPLEYWPRWDGCISMDFISAKDGIQFFKFTFSDSYKELQRKFDSSGASHDPNMIVMLLNQHPYHVESLLALSELYKHLGEYQMAVEWLERCLYAFECAWHPWFNPFQGTCRLLFTCEENRSFFLALFKHMQHLGRRGCHRSAFEVCKLILCLDPDDSLGALFCIDYFALRAEQFEWLEQFVENYSSDSSLALLPNFSFSLAVARFHLEHNSTSSSSILGGLDVNGVEHEQKVPSSDLLKQALMLHPATLKKILDKAPIKVDAAWAKILKHTHFWNAKPGGPSLEHLINLYVERNYLIWRVPELQVWLKSAASGVVNSADGERNNWSCVRQESFKSENNEYRHLHISEFSDSAPTIPPEELQNMMGHGNGIEEVNQNVNIDQGQHDGAGLAGRNALLLFLQSLLPWSDYGVDLQGQDIRNEADSDENVNNEEER